ncbi:hypothetical protein [Chryseobacterium hagamense]|uniref:Uncharacterized protein n=1 Tax=Chryseobacterium hagamense TaxID=395935 RepID=A0A511YK35_9FLAO|nr:hypothetical protein [Chryseobacterium hagamense]GEN75560.1 hypothetical protein CHA01nite_13000 [Chryseobacterium hagamense]
MTTEEFDEEVKDFCPEKDSLKKKVNELFSKGAGTVHVLHFIIEFRNCRLTEAMEIVESCLNYHKRFK